ncbi:mCG19201 [Mus musculus]|nr:mCG19201 [Mus musculus]
MWLSSILANNLNKRRHPDDNSCYHNTLPISAPQISRLWSAISCPSSRIRKTWGLMYTCVPRNRLHDSVLVSGLSVAAASSSQHERFD